MITFGIDPGLSGGIAALDDEGRVKMSAPLMVIRDKSLAWIDGSILRSVLLTYGGGNARVVIERVAAMPGQGVSSMFTFGAVFGSIMGVVQCVGIPLEFVTPVTWKGGLGLSRDKNASLYKARLLFPDAPLGRQKDEGIAEALLIAHWALLQRRKSAA